MAFLILGLFIIFVSVISAYRKRHDRLQQETDENFWKREQEANHVRRQDISGLPYINIPLENFSIGVFQDNALADSERRLKELSTKKILNLGRQTNTDLKLKYGPANLPALTEYDQNFTDMLCTLTEYAKRLIELEHMTEAVPVLEFCVNCGSDISSHYTDLAAFYKQNGDELKLAELKEKANSLDSIMKETILKKLNAADGE